MTEKATIPEINLKMSKGIIVKHKICKIKIDKYTMFCVIKLPKVTSTVENQLARSKDVNQDVKFFDSLGNQLARSKDVNQDVKFFDSLGTHFKCTLVSKALEKKLGTTARIEDLDMDDEQVSQADGVFIDFVEKTYTPMKGIEWLVVQRSTLHMTIRKAKNHLKKYDEFFKTRRLADKFGL